MALNLDNDIVSPKELLMRRNLEILNSNLNLSSKDLSRVPRLSFSLLKSKEGRKEYESKLMQSPCFSKTDPEIRFELLECIGRGRYGEVYKARNRETNEFVAVKVIQAKREYDENQILKEVTILNECNHPNVVKYFGSHFKDCNAWIVMELCGGGTIREIVNELKYTLTEEQISYVCREILKGLTYIHHNKKNSQRYKRRKYYSYR